MQPFMPFSTVCVCINNGDLSEQVHVNCVCTYVGLPSLQVIQGHALCSQWHRDVLNADCYLLMGVCRHIAHVILNRVHTGSCIQYVHFNWAVIRLLSNATFNHLTSAVTGNE